MTAIDDEGARRRPTGRRVGDSGTREAILDAALDRFSTHGYDATSMRGIATDAGVDPALIRHFFGDKETLFAMTVADRTAIPARMTAAFAGPSDGIGARVADTYLRLWEDAATRPILLALVRSATTSGRAAAMLAEVLGERARARRGDDDDDDGDSRHVALAAAHLLGVAIARHVIALPALADVPHDELVAELAPSIQRYLGDATG